VARAPDPLPAAQHESELAVADATEADTDALDSVTVVTRADTEALDALPEAEDTAAAAAATPDTLELDADSVADALSQALADPVVNTGEPESLPEDQTASAPPTAADLREVTGDTVNLRDGPGTNFNVVDRLSRGTVISVLDTGPDGWVYVEINGLTGWMSSDFLGPQI